MDLFQISLPDGSLAWVGLYEGQYPFVAKEKSIIYLFCAMSKRSVSECLKSARKLSLEKFFEFAETHPILKDLNWKELGLIK